MIRKLQMKFVAVSMTMVTAILAVVFVCLFLSVKQNTMDISRQILSRVIAEETLAPGSSGIVRPDIDIRIGGDRVLLPYFTVSVWGSTAYITGGTYANLEDTDTLQAILDDCLAQDAPEGLVSAYQLRYLRQENGIYQRIAFVDMSMELAMLRDLMVSYLQIGLVAFLLLLAVSILLARWATGPVERAWRQQRQFLSDASHELKTPLTVILSNAELLGEAALTDKPARWTDNIRSEARQMKSLVEEMLILARADNMVRTAVLTEVSLSDVAADCALAFEPVAFEAGKPLQYDLAENAVVPGDRDKLRQVVSILLDNAIKYGAAGGAIVMTLQKMDRLARLTVSNGGEVIPPDQLPRLFERFYRADASRGEQSGFGLGLPIAAAIAQEHKGTLRAESDAVSTRFTLSLPLKK